MFQILLICALVRSSLAIVGGDIIDITKAPYQAFLTTDGGSLCGAVVVSADTVVTTATCLVRSTGPVVYANVRVGSNFRDEGGRLIQGKGFVVHPKYDNANHNFDVALLYLDEILTFGPKIQPIPISSDRLYSGAGVEASGWGATAEGAPVTNSLRSVHIQISPTSLCKQAYGSYLGDGMFCAGTVAGGQGTCNGDSGGPVVMNGILIGLTSQGKGCARAATPSIFANIPAAHDWIVQNIK